MITKELVHVLVLFYDKVCRVHHQNQSNIPVCMIYKIISYFITTKYDSEKSKCQKCQKAGVFCLMQGAYTEKQSNAE